MQQRQVQVGVHLSSCRTALVLAITQQDCPKEGGGNPMLLIILHVYLCTHIALASQNAWCHYQAGTASCKHPEPTHCLYMCAFAYHKGNPSFLTGPHCHMVWSDASIHSKHRHVNRLAHLQGGNCMWWPLLLQVCSWCTHKTLLLSSIGKLGE